MARCEPLQAQSAAGREPLDHGLVLAFGGDVRLQRGPAASSASSSWDVCPMRGRAVWSAHNCAKSKAPRSSVTIKVMGDPGVCQALARRGIMILPEAEGQAQIRISKINLSL